MTDHVKDVGRRIADSRKQFETFRRQFIPLFDIAVALAYICYIAATIVAAHFIWKFW